MYSWKSSTVILVGCFVQAVFASEWAYSGEHGPDSWASIEGSKCGGSRQSPVDIDTDHVIDEHWEDFLFRGYDLVEENAGRPLKLLDNGHTLTIFLEGEYLVSLGGLGDQYKAVQFHFHWGSSDIQGSEHTVDGHRYAAEMHVVHYSTRFADFNEAAASTDINALAVLGFFLEIHNETNLAFEEIFNMAHLIQYAGQEVSLEDHQFSVSDLLPEDKKHFYRYYGSLTTPMCNEIVNWTLFKETIKISEDQINELRQLHEGSRADPSAYIVDNFRPTQPLNGRSVFYNA